MTFRSVLVLLFLILVACLHQSVAWTSITPTFHDRKVAVVEESVCRFSWVKSATSLVNRFLFPDFASTLDDTSILLHLARHVYYIDTESLTWMAFAMVPFGTSSFSVQNEISEYLHQFVQEAFQQKATYFVKGSKFLKDFEAAIHYTGSAVPSGIVGLVASSLHTFFDHLSCPGKVKLYDYVLSKVHNRFPKISDKGPKL